tara:strand:+ start:2805 stop:3572 length:768 start_codon:yes stop_codon:yes gene_type:complete
MSQSESQPAPEDNDEVFPLSELSESQRSVYARKLKTELKSIVNENRDIASPVDVNAIDEIQVSYVNNFVDAATGPIICDRGDKLLEQLAEAAEATWTDMNEAKKWLTNFIRRSMLQLWMASAMSWVTTIVAKQLDVKSPPTPEAKIVWAHLDDCVNEAIKLLKSTNGNFSDCSQNNEDSEDDPDDDDNDSADSSKSASGSSSENEDDVSEDEDAEYDLEIDPEELKAEAKAAGIKRKRRLMRAEEEEEEAAATQQ